MARHQARPPDTAAARSSARTATPHVDAPSPRPGDGRQSSPPRPGSCRHHPSSAARKIRRRKDFNLRSELTVGHKVGINTSARTAPDGPHRRDTYSVTPRELKTLGRTRNHRGHLQAPRVQVAFLEQGPIRLEFGAALREVTGIGHRSPRPAGAEASNAVPRSHGKTCINRLRHSRASRRHH